MGRHRCQCLGQIVKYFLLQREERERRLTIKPLFFSFRILVTSDGSGLIETLRNTVSIHSIKKDAYTRGWNEKGAVFTLYDYFEKVDILYHCALNLHIDFFLLAFWITRYG